MLRLGTVLHRSLPEVVLRKIIHLRLSVQRDIRRLRTKRHETITVLCRTLVTGPLPLRHFLLLVRLPSTFLRRKSRLIIRMSHTSHILHFRLRRLSGALLVRRLHLSTSHSNFRVGTVPLRTRTLVSTRATVTSRWMHRFRVHTTRMFVRRFRFLLLGSISINILIRLRLQRLSLHRFITTRRIMALYIRVTSTINLARS